MSSKTRAGLLLAALTLVGGTGCYTMSRADREHSQQIVREREAVRQQRVAQLAPQAAAGDPSTKVVLAFALIAAYEPDERDLQRALALLEQAAADGSAQARVMLGEMLVTGRVFRPQAYTPVRPGLRNAARGIALLKQAAMQACAVRVVGDDEAASYMNYSPPTVSPSSTLARYLEREGRQDEALLWHARSILHCNQDSGPGTFYGAALQALPPAQRRTLLALQLLRGDRAAIARIGAGMTPADVEGAGRAAADLRRRVAESEREYSAPTRKELP